MTPHSTVRGESDPGAGQLPRVFGRYVLFDRIGRGGMADIFLARADTAFGGSRLCVLKQILPQLGHDPGFERMLVGEAKLAAQLTHANIVQVFDLGRADDRLFIAMEYVEGFDLNQLLRALSDSRLGLPAEFAMLIIRDVLRGLDYAHRSKDAHGRSLGLVHRDVSPSNVLVSFEGEVKLCDFGIAKALSVHDEGLSALQAKAPRVVGKSAYMSPEQARGEPLDARADLFAAGILLWELCAGRRMYRGSEEQMLSQARAADVPPLPDRGMPNMPALTALLASALAPQPEARFQSAQEFLMALEDYAMAGRLMVSQLRFGTFLTDHFGERILQVRRERERAARVVASNIPPPMYTEPSSEQTPTVVAENLSALMNERITPVAGDALGGWKEPGAEDSAARSAAPREGNDPAPHSGELPGSELSEGELSRSLMGLDLLSAQQPPFAPMAHHHQSHSFPPPGGPSLSVPPAGPGQREWLWYVAAAAILAIGVVGYLWR